MSKVHLVPYFFSTGSVGMKRKHLANVSPAIVLPLLMLLMRDKPLRKSSGGGGGKNISIPSIRKKEGSLSGWKPAAMICESSLLGYLGRQIALQDQKKNHQQKI